MNRISLGDTAAQPQQPRPTGPIFAAADCISRELISVENAAERLQNCLNRLRTPPPKAVNSNTPPVGEGLPASVEGRLDSLQKRAAENAAVLHALAEAFENALAG